MSQNCELSSRLRSGIVRRLGFKAIEGVQQKASKVGKGLFLSLSRGADVGIEERGYKAFSAWLKIDGNWTLKCVRLGLN